MAGRADVRVPSLALAILVVLSGCAGFSPAPPTAGATPPDRVTTQRPLEPASDSPLNATSPSAVSNASSVSETRAANNPWGHAPIVVAIDAPEGDERRYAPLVESAVDHWRTNATGDAHAAETAYDPAFVVASNASNPDVRVSVVEHIDSCGEYHGDDALGCAPVLNESSDVDDTVSVRVTAGYDDETTTSVLAHEFGHLLGFTHADAEAHPVMATRLDATRVPVPNASTRAVPFRNETLAVYVDLSNVSETDRDAYETEVEHALAYYRSGADGFVPEGVTLTRTSDPARADVVVGVVTFEQGPSGARWRRTGESVDDDAAYEWYTGGTVLVDSDVGPSLVDWYVGAGLGYLLAAQDRAALPPPFRDGSLRDDPAWTGVANETA